MRSRLRVLQLLLAGAIPCGAAAQAPPLRLDSMVVVGTRVSPGLSALTRSVDVLDRDVLQALPVRSTSQALHWVLGVDVVARSSAQADLSIRGSSAEQVLVLVDGIPVNDRQTAHFDLDLAVPLDRIERIEVLRGPASSSYGSNAMGGVVNVVTRSPEPHLEARVEGGSFGTLLGGASAGISVGSAMIAAGAGVSRSDGHREGTDHRTSEVHLSGVSPMWSGTMAADAGYLWKNFGAADFYAPYPSYEEVRTGTAAVAWRGEIAQGLELEPRVSYRRHKDYFVLDRDAPSLYSNRHMSSQLAAEAAVRYRDGRGVRLGAGTVVGRDILESTNLGDRTEDRWAVFAEAAILRGPWALNVGARGDHYDGYGFFPTPSFSAAFQGGSLRVHGSVGRSFRAPTWTERYYEDPVNRGNPDLAPEAAWTAEAGATVAVGGDVQLAVTGYQRRAVDLIDWARPEGGTGPWETRNVESATFRGIELEVSGIRVAGAHVFAKGAALSVSADSAAGFVSKYALRPLTQYASVGAGRAFGMFRTETRLDYRRREGESGYWLWDIRFAARLRVGEVYVDLLNGLDAQYADITGAPAPGRSVMVGLRAGT